MNINTKRRNEWNEATPTWCSRSVRRKSSWPRHRDMNLQSICCDSPRSRSSSCSPCSFPRPFSLFSPGYLKFDWNSRKISWMNISNEKHKSVKRGDFCIATGKSRNGQWTWRVMKAGGKWMETLMTRGRGARTGREGGRERVERTEDWQIWIEPNGQGGGAWNTAAGQACRGQSSASELLPCILLLLPFRLFTKRYSKRERGQTNGEWKEKERATWRVGTRMEGKGEEGNAPEGINEDWKAEDTKGCA